MKIREGIIDFMHDRAVAATAAQNGWLENKGYDSADFNSNMTVTDRLVRCLHWLRVNVTEALEEIATPDDQIDSLMKSRLPRNTIGADE